MLIKFDIFAQKNKIFNQNVRKFLSALRSLQTLSTVSMLRWKKKSFLCWTRLRGKFCERKTGNTFSIFSTGNVCRIFGSFLARLFFGGNSRITTFRNHQIYNNQEFYIFFLPLRKFHFQWKFIFFIKFSIFYTK